MVDKEDVVWPLSSAPTVTDKSLARERKVYSLTFWPFIFPQSKADNNSSTTTSAENTGRNSSVPLTVYVPSWILPIDILHRSMLSSDHCITVFLVCGNAFARSSLTSVVLRLVETIINLPLSLPNDTTPLCFFRASRVCAISEITNLPLSSFFSERLQDICAILVLPSRTMFVV